MKSKRLQQRPHSSAKKVGLAHLRKDQWQRWLEIVYDRDTWPESYEAWHKQIEEMADRLRRAGLEVIWVELDVEQFEQWCKSRGYQNDREARSRYAAEQIGNIPPPAEPR